MRCNSLAEGETTSVVAVNTTDAPPLVKGASRPPICEHGGHIFFVFFRAWFCKGLNSIFRIHELFCYAYEILERRWDFSSEFCHK